MTQTQDALENKLTPELIAEANAMIELSKRDDAYFDNSTVRHLVGRLLRAAQPVPQAAGVDVVKHATALVILINKCPLLFEFGDTSKREKISRKVKQLENALSTLPSEPVLSEQAALGVDNRALETAIKKYHHEVDYLSEIKRTEFGDDALKTYSTFLAELKEIKAALQNAASQGGK